MRRALVSLCLALTLALPASGCMHWYTRGLLATTGGAALGLGVGGVIPCPNSEPGCHPSQMALLATIMALSTLVTWGTLEIVTVHHTASSSDSSYDYSGDDSSSSSSGDSTTSSGGGDDDGSTPTEAPASSCPEGQVEDCDGHCISGTGKMPAC